MSPMMTQYLETKKQYEGYLLFYRLGDFYEMFFDDAVTASRELDLTLTGRDCGEGERAPMCGVPFHACDTYIARLVEKGYKVAICEQLEDPATCKGIVPRDVIRIVTPGTVTLGEALDQDANNYLVSVFVEGEEAGVVFYDLSQKNAQGIAMRESSREKLFSGIVNEFAKFNPKEMLTNLPESECAPLVAFLQKRSGCAWDCGLYDLFEDKNLPLINRQFSKTPEELGMCPGDALARSAAALIAYLAVTQKTTLSSLTGFSVYSTSEFLAIDATSRKNLELCETLHGREKRGSLLWVLDRTKTSAGARALRRFLEEPLTNCRAIAKRQSAVLEFFNSLPLRENVREALSGLQDIERLLSRVIYKTASARDLFALGNTLTRLPKIAELIRDCEGEALSGIARTLENKILPETAPLADLICRAVSEDAPASIREGGYIREGYSEELDELRSIMSASQKYLAKIEAQEQELTGIPKLHIGYNRVFGYYFEVSKSQIPLVPERYIRKQTLVNAERYITQELKDMESRILGARESSVALENEIFLALCESVREKTAFLQEGALLLAEIDVFASLAEVAQKNNYTCPVVDYSDKLELRDSRHPVVEQFTRGFFVPNDVDLDCSDKRMNIITGPNMAGKSTYMRQCAVIVIMAQIGSFVPAKSAHVGMVDKIFTRVGASDDLSLGQSTFMLEMSEVAYILENATKKSLIIYDEIGRGTSTYDGMSIARAVVEYTAGKKCGAKTLFATHYHELSVLESTIPGVRNFNIAAKKKGDSVVFLRKIVPGSADDSYGIEVASLAGVPAEVIRRAKEILRELEAENPRPKKEVAEQEVLPLCEPIRDSIIEELKNTQVDTLTPIEALGKLYDLSKKAKEI